MSAATAASGAEAARVSARRAFASAFSGSVIIEVLAAVIAASKAEGAARAAPAVTVPAMSQSAAAAIVTVRRIANPHPLRTRALPSRLAA